MVEHRLKTLTCILLATGFGVGKVPKAPGTAGSLLGIALVALIFPSTWWIQLLLVIAVAAVAVWTSHWVEVALGETDPQIVVIDEVVGQWVALLWVPIHWQSLLAGFVLFRLFDIWKPGPIRKAGHLPGGVGIVADDVLAGVAANIILQIAFRMVS